MLIPGQEKYYGRSVTIADREMVESNSDEILRDAQTEDVAFLVVGDPFGYVRSLHQPAPLASKSREE